MQTIDYLQELLEGQDKISEQIVELTNVQDTLMELGRSMLTHGTVMMDSEAMEEEAEMEMGIEGVADWEEEAEAEIG